MLQLLGTATAAAQRRRLQQTPLCPCRSCLGTPSASLATCESMGLDCSCVTDCAACRLCSEFNPGIGGTSVCSGLLGQDCSCLQSASSTSHVCTAQQLSLRLKAVNAKCCSGAAGECSEGAPTTCNVECAAVFLPFWHDCGAQLQHIYGTTLASCHATASACASKPCVNGQCSASQNGHRRLQSGFSCVCDLGWTGITCNAPLPVDLSLPLRALGKAAGVMVGTAGNYKRIHSGQYPHYTTTLAREYNALTPENSMKMAYLQPRPGHWDFSTADALVTWAASKQMIIRAHNLVWTGRNPKWLVQSAPSMSALALNALMRAHIENAAKHFSGRVYSWDVVNEAIENNVPRSRRCGNWRCWLKTGSRATPVNWNRTSDGSGATTYVERAFRYARAADPHAKLFYNEYGIHTTNEKFTNVSPAWIIVNVLSIVTMSCACACACA